MLYVIIIIIGAECSSVTCQQNVALKTKFGKRLRKLFQNNFNQLSTNVLTSKQQLKKNFPKHKLKSTQHYRLVGPSISYELRKQKTNIYS